ncbi:hypothetical protein ACC771_11140, partial [Rhizobium ruizarguesonis]
RPTLSHGLGVPKVPARRMQGARTVRRSLPFACAQRIRGFAAHPLIASLSLRHFSPFTPLGRRGMWQPPSSPAPRPLE